jgi:hypothetical protein
LEAALKDSKKQWAGEWFVVANPTLSLLPRTGYPLIINDKLKEMPSKDEMVQVRIQLADLNRLKADKLTEAAVARSFSKRLTQPI